MPLDATHFFEEMLSGVFSLAFAVVVVGNPSLLVDSILTTRKFPSTISKNRDFAGGKGNRQPIPLSILLWNPMMFLENIFSKDIESCKQVFL